MHRRRLTVLAVLLLLAAACGGDGDDGQTANGDGPMADETVGVELREFTVTPAADAASAGSIEFDVRNGGGIPHEFLVIQTDLAPDALPTDGGAVDEEAEDLTVVGEIGLFGPNSSESLTVDLEAGDYVLICNVPGHYQAGMTAGFMVG